MHHQKAAAMKRLFAICGAAIFLCSCMSVGKVPGFENTTPTPSSQAWETLEQTETLVPTPYATVGSALSQPASVSPPSSCPSGLLAFRYADNLLMKPAKGIYLVCSDGSSRQLILPDNGSMIFTGLALSPGDNVLHVMTASNNGTAINDLDMSTHKLTGTLQLPGASNIQWSSNDYVAFIANHPDQAVRNSLRILHIPTNTLSILESDGVLNDFSWSPDGERIFYTYESPAIQELLEIIPKYIARVECDPVSYACTIDQKKQLEHVDPDAIWFEDSRSLVSVLRQENRQNEFIITDVNDTIVRTIDLGSINHNITQIIEFAPSHDGKRLAFVANVGNFVQQVFVLDIERATLTQLSPADNNVHYHNLVWLP